MILLKIWAIGAVVALTFYIITTLAMYATYHDLATESIRLKLKNNGYSRTLCAIILAVSLWPIVVPGAIAGLSIYGIKRTLEMDIENEGGEVP